MHLEPAAQLGIFHACLSLGFLTVSAGERAIYENSSNSRSQSALLNLYQRFSSSLGEAG